MGSIHGLGRKPALPLWVGGHSWPHPGAHPESGCKPVQTGTTHNPTKCSQVDREPVAKTAPGAISGGSSAERRSAVTPPICTATNVGAR